MLEMLEAMFFCNTIAKLASNMEITMLEMLEAIVFLQHYRKTRLSQPPGLPNWETFTMLEMLEVIVFYNTIAKLACNMQEARAPEPLGG